MWCLIAQRANITDKSCADLLKWNKSEQDISFHLNSVLLAVTDDFWGEARVPARLSF